MPTAKSDLVAHFMKNYWIGVFGPPDVFMSDGGSEFAAVTESLMRTYMCPIRWSRQQLSGEWASWRGRSCVICQGLHFMGSAASLRRSGRSGGRCGR